MKNMRTTSISKSLLLMAAFAFSSSALAQQQATKISAPTAATPAQTSVTTAGPKEVEDKKLTVDVGIEYSQKIAKDQVGQREAETGMLLAIGYKVNSLATVSAKTIFSQENFGQRNSAVDNTKIALGIKGIQINDDLKTTHSIAAIAPTNETARKVDRLQGGVSLANGLKYNTLYADITYALTLTKNIHEYTFNAEGSPNVEYSMANAVDVVVPVTDAFSVSFSGAYINGQTYGGMQRSKYSLGADLNYEVVKNLAVNVGTTNEAKAFKSNGVDSNIEAYNANTSVFRAGVAYSY